MTWKRVITVLKTKTVRKSILCPTLLQWHNADRGGVEKKDKMYCQHVPFRVIHKNVSNKTEGKMYETMKMN